MTRVAAAPRIPGGLRPRGTITGTLGAAGARATVRWDDGLVTSMPTHSLVELPAPRADVYYSDDEWSPIPFPSSWNVDCERDGQYVGTEEFATEAEARAWAERWN